MKRNAFTLVELLIVVVILAILAAIALPKFSNASQTARASMLADDLRIIRTQLEVFRGQHNGVAAGYPNCDPTQAPTEQAFIEHMTKSSNAQGDVASPGTPGYRYGPYLREMVVNPLSSKSSIQIIADGQPFPSEPDESYSWVYQPSTLRFHASCRGSDDAGVPYFKY